MDLETVKYLADLSKITFTQEELEEMAKDMTDIIEIMDTVRDIDIIYDDTKDNTNVYLYDLRTDTPKESMPAEKILANAKTVDDCYVVPKVVE